MVDEIGHRADGPGDQLLLVVRRHHDRDFHVLIHEGKPSRVSLPGTRLRGWAGAGRKVPEIFRRMWNTVCRLFSADKTRFLLVGGLCYAIDVGVLVLLHSGLQLPLATATSLAFVTVLAINFGLNRTFVFHSGALAGPAFFKYLVLVGFNYGATVTTVTGLTALGMPYVAAKTTSTIVNAVVNYSAFRWWVFRTPGTRQPDGAASPAPSRLP
ncbi:GtrA family protein [Streptomyces sp. NPDC051940]|uniref:GtrA family protein n=1 Tax=Streptomyces sp. NPDC051940 TaxID=3155675 RepID=UPI00343D7DAE